MHEIIQRKIAASAELLQERIENGHTDSGERPERSANPVEFDDAVRADLRDWLDVDDLEQYANFEVWPADERLPEWTSTFADMVEYVRNADGSASAPDGRDDAVPFEEFFTRIVDFTRQHSLDSFDDEYLTEEALGDLEGHLLDRLVDAGAQALHIDFVTYIAEHDATILENGELSSESTEWYERYVSDLLDERIVSFFERYPLLARLLVVESEQWAATVSRFVTRLADDYSAIRSLVGNDEPGRIAGVDSQAGDPHAQGQTVIIAKFESGDEVVYKPRDVEPEKQLYDFQSWLERRDDDFPELQTPDVIARSAYGWMEKVDVAAFSSDETVGTYYRRAGALLCVLYVLNAYDCHFENVVAGDTSPVVVDAETILHEDVRTTEAPTTAIDNKLRKEVVGSSLLNTLMLPFELDDDGNTISGLGMTDEHAGKLRNLEWVNVNTDAMDIEYHVPTIVPENNVPTYGGEPALPSQFVDEIIDGFETAYDVIANSQDAVDRRIADQFSGIRVRNVIQNTVLYQALLDTITNPTYLEDGVAPEYKIYETLSKKLTATPFVKKADWLNDVLDAEREAITRRDVPRFTTVTDEDGLYIGEKKVASEVFEKSGIEGVRTRLAELSEEDKAFQSGLIRACLSNLRAANESHVGGY